MAQVQLDEKRLKTIRAQLYGKEVKVKKNFNDSKSSTEKVTHFDRPETPAFRTPADPVSSTAMFLKTDLLRIIILSTLAIGTQLFLYFAIRNGFLSLDSFKF